MAVRAIILADGPAKRWNHPTPKHLITLNDEVLLHRTVRQLKSRAVTDLWVTSHDVRYEITGVNRFEPENNEFQIDQFYACSPLWRHHGPVVFLYGDVYFSEAAMDTILGSITNSYLYFQRTHGSKVTGKIWKEGFAMKVANTELFYHALATLRHLIVTRAIEHAHHQVQGYLEGNGTGHYWGLGPHGIEIDDETDDFDSPEEVTQWLHHVRCYLNRVQI
jgi:hypothetical protein